MYLKSEILLIIKTRGSNLQIVAMV